LKKFQDKKKIHYINNFEANILRGQYVFLLHMRMYPYFSESSQERLLNIFTYINAYIRPQTRYNLYIYIYIYMYNIHIYIHVYFT